MRTKLRNYISGNQVDKTFKAGETVEQAEIDKRSAQFTYEDGSDVRPLPGKTSFCSVRCAVDVHTLELNCRIADPIRSQ